jgi:hypothetical protein
MQSAWRGWEVLVSGTHFTHGLALEMEMNVFKDQTRASPETHTFRDSIQDVYARST